MTKSTPTPKCLSDSWPRNQLNPKWLENLPDPRGPVTRFQDKSGYSTPVGKLSSVTTVLGKTAKNKERLEKWKARPDAAAISEEACNRGTWLHTCNETWLQALKDGEPLPDFKHFAFGGYWRSMRPFLEKHMLHMVAQECAVYHPGLYTAGQFDCLGYTSYTEQEGLSEEEASEQLCLLDWKTSKNFRGFKSGDFRDKNGKPNDLVNDYFCQLGAYSMSIKYVYGVEVERALLVVARPHGDWPDIWELPKSELDEYGKQFLHRANNYFQCEEGFEK